MVKRRVLWCASENNFDETGTYVVQCVRQVPEEHRYDHRLMQSVRGTPSEPRHAKRPAESDAECLEEEATSAEADSERRLALKRKAEGDLDESRWRTP